MSISRTICCGNSWRNSAMAKFRPISPSTIFLTRPVRFTLSPFEEAAIVTGDGVGEWATTTIGRGRGKDIEPARVSLPTFDWTALFRVHVLSNGALDHQRANVSRYEPHVPR
jgi:hypothetical protein